MNITEMTLSVIRDFCVRGLAFTSLDVSNTVKANFKDETISHSDVANQVRKILDQKFLNNAKMSSKEVLVSLSSGAKFKTTLYYNNIAGCDNYKQTNLEVLPVKIAKGEDVKVQVSKPIAKDYTSVSIKTKPIKDVVAELKNSVETVIENSQFVSTDLMFVRNVKSDGRLEIPTELFDKLNWGADERCVYLKNTDKSFIITTKDIDNRNKIFENYMSEGRVRVPKTVFVKCSLPCDNKNQYVISASSRVKNMIVVSLA